MEWDMIDYAGGKRARPSGGIREVREPAGELGVLLGYEFNLDERDGAKRAGAWTYFVPLAAVEQVCKFTPADGG